MEERKRTLRPAYKAMVKELEKRLDEQIEGTSLLVKECNVWRKKYRTALSQVQFASDEGNKLLCKNATLEQSNKLMQVELQRMREREKELTDKYNAQSDDYFRLRHRGFFARLFNLK